MRILRLPLEGLVAFLELLLSRRGVSVGFLLFAGLFAVSTWLRPPLSTDIRGIHLPLGIVKTDDHTPEEILYGPRNPGVDSAGVIVMAFVAAGMLVVLWRPRLVGVVAGVLLSVSIGCHAAVLNHPALIELLDLEQRERQTMAGVIREMDEDSVTTPYNGRVNTELADRESWGNLARSFHYILYGWWLLPWAACGVLVGGQGRLSQRFLLLTGWAILGMGIGVSVCSQRLLAEYYWAQAGTFRDQGRFNESREAFHRATALFPEFYRMTRTWLLAGELDHHEGRTTPQRLYYRAVQLSGDRERPLGVTLIEDLRWPSQQPANTTEEPVAVPADPTQDLLQQTRPSLRTAQLIQQQELREAIEILENLLSDDGRGNGGFDAAPVRRHAAQLWTELGLRSFRGEIYVTEPPAGPDKAWQGLAGARKAWRRAVEILPSQRDCPYYLGLAQAHADRARPDLVAAELNPLLAGLADRALKADILATLGDAYFEAGRMSVARELYRRSQRSFDLPKEINYRARKGLTGL